ncbi:hypothetical protein IRT45_34940 [Nocardia sp. BSTN01]|uniref:hypothetical protein n=1 Tax=Nocardia sp. BSTN01 TaxID=2783665 RepID=UPI00188F7A39|nr:hypothetical protein [Nocardia sp. BSTN01]MBF5002317.1 hypothetical protein [Nocardia sp. BSTN01]
MTKADVRCARCKATVPDNMTLCQRCGTDIVADLLTVPALLAELTVTRAGQAQFNGERTGGRSAETPLPIRPTKGRTMLGGLFAADPIIQGDTALTRLSTAVGEWARLLAKHHRVAIPIGAPGLVQLVANGRTRAYLPETSAAWQPAGRGTARDHTHTTGTVMRVDGVVPYKPRKRIHVSRRNADALTSPATAVEQAAIWLACHPLELRRFDTAGDLASDIHQALKQIRATIDRPREPRQIGPCPECGVELLAHPDDDGRLPAFVRCRGCDTQQEVDTVMQRALDAVRDRLFTVLEIVRITAQFGSPVAKRTLHRWAHDNLIEYRGYLHTDKKYGTRITDHPIHPRDPRVYRLGDVLDIARRDQKGTAA